MIMTSMMTTGKATASAAPPMNNADGIQMRYVEKECFSLNTSESIMQHAIKAHRYIDEDVIQKKISPVPGMSRKNEIMNDKVNREFSGKAARR